MKKKIKKKIVKNDFFQKKIGNFFFWKNTKSEKNNAEKCAIFYQKKLKFQNTKNRKN